MISNVANNIVIDSEQQNSRGRKDNYCEEDSLSFSRNKSKDF